MLLALLASVIIISEQKNQHHSIEFDLTRYDLFNPIEVFKTDVGFIVTEYHKIVHIHQNGILLGQFADDTQGPYGLRRPKIVSITSTKIVVIGHLGQFITFDHALEPMKSEGLPSLPDAYKNALWSARLHNGLLEATTYEPKRKPLSVVFQQKGKSWEIKSSTPERPPVDKHNHFGDQLPEGSRKTGIWFATNLVLFKPEPYTVKVYDGLPGLSKVRLELRAPPIVNHVHRGLSYAVENYGLLTEQYFVELQGFGKDGERVRQLDLFDLQGNHVDRIELDPDQRVIPSSNSREAWIITGADIEVMQPLLKWLTRR